MSSVSGTQYKSTLLKKTFQYMYHSYQLYTRNMGLSYCILGMGNLIGYVQVNVKYQVFWKVISIKSAFLNFVWLVGTFWHLCEMSEFHIVHGKPGANSTC